MVDDGFSYFEYTQCLTELVSTGHVDKSENRYKITEKGAEQEATVESGIPYSVRLKAERKTSPLAEKMKRDTLIGTSHETLKSGGCQVRLSLSDGIGEIISMSILASGENQAESMEKYFRSDAENIYHKLVSLLTPENP